MTSTNGFVAIGDLLTTATLSSGAQMILAKLRGVAEADLESILATFDADELRILVALLARLKEAERTAGHENNDQPRGIDPERPEGPSWRR